MTRDALLDAMGAIRDDFIREAAPPAASYRGRREFPWAAAVAACLALLVVSSTVFLSWIGVGGGNDTTANDATSATTGEAGESVAEDGTDSATGGSAPQTSLPETVTVEGTDYILAENDGAWPEDCPAGLVPAGEVELPDTGEICAYFAAPDQQTEIWVYQTCYDEETGTAYMGYVRYVAETAD